MNAHSQLHEMGMFVSVALHCGIRVKKLLRPPLLKSYHLNESIIIKRHVYVVLILSLRYLMSHIFHVPTESQKV